MHRCTAEVVVIDMNAAGIGLDQADDHVEGSGLACAVGAEQADDAALAQGQTEIVDDATSLVALGQIGGR